ncbi:MAG: methyltransferase domain-containing protein [Treponema sp.]|nr:methyltransferase domain-containing protein [Treponema sp.]
MKNKRTVIVQCRLSSSRLPEKALKLLNDKTVLSYVLASMHKIPADRYFVATDEASYEKIKPICLENGFECFAGDLNNVLKRFCDLIEKINADTVIRATADNPFLFYEAAEASLLDFEERNRLRKTCDYLTYSGLPHGSGVEIFSGKSLLEAAKKTDNPYDLEHVGPALYNHKENFNCQFVKAPSRFNHPELRTTIDTYSDYLRAICAVNYLSEKKLTAPYTTEQILQAFNSTNVVSPVIFAPSVKKGHGTGHLHRCLGAAIETNSFVFIPEDSDLEEVSNILEEYKAKGLKNSQIINTLPDESLKPVIISDSFKLTEKEIQLFSNARALISLDEGSEFCQKVDFLLDIIPPYEPNRIVNLFDSSFIEKPENVKVEQSRNFNKILICIGGEDPAGLTIPAANLLSKKYPEAEITAIISGDFNKITCGKSQIDNIKFLPPVKNLKNELYKFDLVVTHYGLTAFEATAAGCGVVLLATSKLHEKLAEKYNFSYVCENKLDEKRLSAAIASEKVFPKLPVSMEHKSLGQFLQKVAGGKKMLCPICQKNKEKPDSIVARNITKTYRRCSDCGMIYMSYSTNEEKTYEKEYFFEDYKKQYGKTYKEDFDSIKKQCIRRVEVIDSLKINEKSKNVLDIGCAYGPFLAAAAEKNYNPFGTDISEDAVTYVKKELHFPASRSAFPEINTVEEFGISHFDVVSMWYVIEHFKNLDEVLSKVSQIVKKGGIFAFSTPSGEGISAKSNPEHFFEISPTDHFSIWEPSKANQILKKYGFTVEKIVSTGHHPERFPSIQKTDSKPGSLKWNAVNKLSKMRNLGDTVEIYCRKTK